MHVDGEFYLCINIYIYIYIYIYILYYITYIYMHRSYQSDELDHCALCVRRRQNMRTISRLIFWFDLD